MKTTRGRGTGGPLDLGTIFDEIFEAAQDFHDEFRRNFNAQNGDCPGRGGGHPWFFDENTDYYPNYSYPPMNVYMTADRSLIFEFALAGFDEKDISLSFQGDYMVFSALMPRTARPGTSETSAESSAEVSEYQWSNRSDNTGENAAGEASHSDENIRYLKRRLKMKDIEKQKYYVPLDKYAQDKVKAVYRNGILKVTIPPKEEPDQSDGIRIEIITED